MSSKDMADKFRDVMQAQKKKVGLLRDVNSIIEAMKGLSHDHGTVIKELAQAHHDEVQQLKRTHTYQMCRLKTEHAAQLKSTTNEHAAKEGKIVDLMQRHQNQSSEDSKQQQFFSCQSKELELAQTVNCQNAELKKQLLQEKNKGNSMRSDLNGKIKELDAARLRYTYGGNRKAIAELLNKELTAYFETADSSKTADLYEIDKARRRIKSLKTASNKRRAAFQVRFNNTRQRLVKLASPLNTAHATGALEKQRKIVITDMEELLRWSDEVIEGLVEKDMDLLEKMETISHTHNKEHDKRIESLFQLSDLCNVADELDWERY